MPSYIRVWIHFVWSTKYRRKLINKEIKWILYDHIRSNARHRGICIDHINGAEDHVHLLIALNGEPSLSKIAFYIKGESSHWANANKLTEVKFEWQNEFYAESVSISAILRIRNYIQNQEKHHRIESFLDEYKRFKNRDYNGI